MVGAATDITIPELDIVGWGAIIGALLVIGVLIRKTVKFAQRVDLFFDDWYGTPASPGHEQKPGMVERVAGLEVAQIAGIEAAADMRRTQEEMKSTQEEMRQKQAEIAENVHRELNRNGGGSTKDAAFEALRVVKELQLQQEAEVKERMHMQEEFHRHQMKGQRERHRMIIAVRQMIGLDVETQKAQWDQIMADFTSGQLGDE